MSGIILSVGAGISAALAGITAKVCATHSVARHFCLSAVSIVAYSASYRDYVEDICDRGALAVRACFFLLTLLLNTVLWWCLSQALSLSANSLFPSVLTAAANILFTALLSQVAFGDQLGRLWWFGFSLILLGLFLIAWGSPSQTGVHATTDRETAAKKVE